MKIKWYGHACAGDPGKNYGVRLNPDKSRLITFTEGDRVIVLAGS